MAANPMYQFNVYRIGPEDKIGNIDISFTNASLFMVISTIAILLILEYWIKKRNPILPDKIQLLSELSYSRLKKLISIKLDQKSLSFSFMTRLFMFVLFCNMFGMIPYY